jgi:hypothetical protein
MKKETKLKHLLKQNPIKNYITPQYKLMKMNINHWGNNTCESCIFRLDKKCRKSPHWENAGETNLIINANKESTWVFKYFPACGEYQYKEKIK